MPLNITRPPVGPVLTYDVNTQRPGCDVDSGRETGERPLPPAHEAKIKFLPLPEVVYSGPRPRVLSSGVSP